MSDKNALASAFLSYESDRFIRMWSSYTERGAALAVVAGLDARIAELMKSVMIQDESTLKQMFSETGTFGAFGTKIRVCYLFGLFSDSTNRELTLINRIRNAFAHHERADDFKWPKIQSLTSSLAIFRNRSEFLKHSDTRGCDWEDLFRRLEWDIAKPNFGFVAESLVLEGRIEDAIALRRGPASCLL